MKAAIENIRTAVAEHCRSREKTELKDSVDLSGTGKLEWESSLILEVRTKIEGKEEGVNSFTQAVPVQFTLGFSAADQHIPVCLQWGKVEATIWQAAEDYLVCPDMASLRDHELKHLRHLGYADAFPFIFWRARFFHLQLHVGPTPESVVQRNGKLHVRQSHFRLQYVAVGFFLALQQVPQDGTR